MRTLPGNRRSCKTFTFSSLGDHFPPVPLVVTVSRVYGDLTSHSKGHFTQEEAVCTIFGWLPPHNLQRMPSRAPSYYHWSQDKPCTTNQTYGFEFKDSVVDLPPGQKRKLGPFDYTRPFSNSAFFPTISHDSSLTAPARSRPLAKLHPCKEFCPPGSKNKFDINKGYVMGHVPVTQKVMKGDVPVGVSLSRTVSAPPAYFAPQPKAKDLYLWHTLSGTLVHCKNYPPSKSALPQRG